MPTSSRLTFGRTSTGYLVVLEGKGTLFQSPGFRELADRCLADPPSGLVIDLSACEYLDSTFLGCLVSLHRKYNGEGCVRVELVAPGDVRSKLLHHSQLEGLFAFTPCPPQFLGEASMIDVSQPDRDTFSRHIQEAHRQLAELGGTDAEAFDQVAQRIAGELDSRDER
jgi:anti-anti-sigma regulatory factor